jgi:hypothetical protein
MLAAIIVVPITNWSGEIETSASRTGYTLSANIDKTHSAGDACSNIDPPNRLRQHGVLAGPLETGMGVGRRRRRVDLYHTYLVYGTCSLY